MRIVQVEWETIKQILIPKDAKAIYTCIGFAFDHWRVGDFTVDEFMHSLVDGDRFPYHIVIKTVALLGMQPLSNQIAEAIDVSNNFF